MVVEPYAGHDTPSTDTPGRVVASVVRRGADGLSALEEASSLRRFSRQIEVSRSREPAPLSGLGGGGPGMRPPSTTAPSRAVRPPGGDRTRTDEPEDVEPTDDDQGGPLGKNLLQGSSSTPSTVVGRDTKRHTASSSPPAATLFAADDDDDDDPQQRRPKRDDEPRVVIACGPPPASRSDEDAHDDGSEAFDDSVRDVVIEDASERSDDRAPIDDDGRDETFQDDDEAARTARQASPRRGRRARGRPSLTFPLDDEREKRTPAEHHHHHHERGTLNIVRRPGGLGSSGPAAWTKKSAAGSNVTQRDESAGGGGVASFSSRGSHHQHNAAQAANVDEDDPEDAGARSSEGRRASGRWSRAEHEEFLRCLAIYGREWKKVSQRITSRTAAQIRSHAQKYFKKMSAGDETAATDAAAGMLDSSATTFSDDATRMGGQPQSFSSGSSGGRATPARRPAGPGQRDDCHERGRRRPSRVEALASVDDMLASLRAKRARLSLQGGTVEDDDDDDGAAEDSRRERRDASSSSSSSSSSSRCGESRLGGGGGFGAVAPGDAEENAPRTKLTKREDDDSDDDDDAERRSGRTRSARKRRASWDKRDADAPKRAHRASDSDLDAARVSVAPDEADERDAPDATLPPPDGTNASSSSSSLLPRQRRVVSCHDLRSLGDGELIALEMLCSRRVLAPGVSSCG